MKILCKRCGTAFPVAEELATQATASVSCPQCGAQYRRKGGAPSVSVAVSAPDFPTRRLDEAARPATSAAPAAPRATPATGSGPRAAATAPIFGADQLVAGRYRVLRFIARGGMGEVYEALDLELHSRVALKTIDPRTAESKDAIERFKREILLARRVTHPNVCRIFDVGYHAADGALDPTIFLTMELLEGQTLATRLRTGGPLPPGQALPLVEQMAAALAAAHAAGVVHRDFKSENVFLVPGPSGPRAVVTDFGVARGVAGDEPIGATMTGMPRVVGTPAYMAPEQLEGQEVTPATDQYAFGVVLYEMLTGRLPFEGDTPFSTAVKRLTEAPPSPRLLVPDLEPRWERTIVRCLARYPGDRFASVAEAAAALAGDAPLERPATRITASIPAAKPRRSPAERRKLLLASALGLVFLAVAAWAIVRVRALSSRHLEEPLAMRRSVAVLGFLNRSGREDAEWLSTALAEMLSTELAARGDLRVIPGENVARSRLELQLAAADSLSRETLSRLRLNLGSDFVVLGSYTALAGESAPLRLDLRIQDTRSGETVSSLAENATEAQLFDLVTRAGARLRAALGMDATATVAEEAWAPASPEAARLYSEGLARLRQFDPEGAREKLEQAVATDPSNALAHSALSSAWSALGYEQRAEDEARRAFELAGKLPREEQLVVEGHFAEASRNFTRAAEIYETLLRAYPDNLDYGLRLAALRAEAGEPDRALAVTAALRALPPPAGEDPAIDLAEATAAGAKSDFTRERAAAARAAEKGRALGAKRLVAQARAAEGWALRNLGQYAPARAAADEARTLFADLGDRGGAAGALATRAATLYDQGDLAGARASYEASLATSRELGDRGSVARALNNLAVVVKAVGERDEARKMYQEALDLCREIGDRGGAAYALLNLGASRSEEGDLAEAKQRFTEALGVRRELGDKSGSASALHNLGGVERRLGNLAAAERSFSEALALRRETGQKLPALVTLTALAQVRLEAGDLVRARAALEESTKLAAAVDSKTASARLLFEQGEVAFAAGDLAAARAAHEQAAVLRRATGEGATAESDFALGRLELASGRPDAATTALAAAAERWTKDGLRDDAARALALAAEARFARGEPAASRAAVAEAESAVASSQNPAARLGVALSAARVAAATGDRAGAAKRLSATLAEAEKLELVGLRLEIALALGRLEAAGADAARGRERLQAVAREARERGFEWIAGQAESPAG
ncbi:MAG: tetratricopeptide repeat protein [Thermoanaerobaculia bacterium]